MPYYFGYVSQQYSKVYLIVCRVAWWIGCFDPYRVSNGEVAYCYQTFDGETLLA